MTEMHQSVHLRKKISVLFSIVSRLRIDTIFVGKASQLVPSSVIKSVAVRSNALNLLNNVYQYKLI